MGLILLIYTTPARLLNALALRGYFREATGKKGSAEAEKTSNNHMAAGFSPRRFSLIHGDADDPHLPKGAVDAVLIANSYHEFTNPLAILDHTFRALRSTGRLVVLDRGPRSYHGESREIQMQQYQIAASVAEDEIRQRGFEVLSRDNHFIDRPAVERQGDRQDDHVWWLIVARKP